VPICDEIAAVRGLAEAHDIEWRSLGIKSRSLMPGFIDTNIISGIDLR
jgi:NAD(P)-dependent dehydrogenase (short-subunit alcohol dehydrogenase family)